MRLELEELLISGSIQNYFKNVSFFIFIELCNLFLLPRKSF